MPPAAFLCRRENERNVWLSIRTTQLTTSSVQYLRLLERGSVVTGYDAMPIETKYRHYPGPHSNGRRGSLYFFFASFRLTDDDETLG